MKIVRAWLAFGCWFLGLASGTAQTSIEAHPDRHLAPAAEGQLLLNPSYLVDFDVQSGVAFWVHYALTAQECMGAVPRKDAFRPDDRVANSPTASSYASSGYDRGHLKPAADSRSSAAEMRNSFLMTNMVPQSPNLNRGIWKKLEEGVRTWGLAYDEVHVTCGPSDLTLRSLSSGVRVPSAFWKVVLRTSPDTTCLAFRFPNADKVPGALEDYLVSVDALEAELGLDLFPSLPDATERRVEGEVAQTIWPLDLPEGAPRPSAAAGQAQSSSGEASVQCMGIAKSTGQRCKQKTTDPSERCRYHRN
jgi:endonuclease G